MNIEREDVTQISVPRKQKDVVNYGQLWIFFLDERHLLILEINALGHCRTVNNNVSILQGLLQRVVKSTETVT